jgi:hypothetical protein
MTKTTSTTTTMTTRGGRDSCFGPLLPTTTTTMPLQPDIVAMHVIHPTKFGGHYHPELMRAVEEEAGTRMTKIGGGDRCFGPHLTMMMMPSRPYFVAMHVVRPTMFGEYYHHPYYHHQPLTWMLNTGY